ncbi:hypothetical protein ACFTSE_23805 [Bacillus cereus]|uniref:hypothetical protein n=1 Tax=Bacillus cereus TaxID=1396 RepID=UPI0036376C02
MLWTLLAIVLFLIGVGTLKGLFRENERKISVILFSVFVLLAAISFGIGKFNSDDTAEKLTEESQKVETTIHENNIPTGQSKVVLSGENAVIIADVYMAILPESLTEYLNYISKNNKNAIMRMAERGELIEVKQGTEVTVVSQSVRKGTQIEIIQTGMKGYVVSTLLEKKY